MSASDPAEQHGASFSMPFPINVDALFDFEAQCAQSAEVVERAEGDAARASSIVAQQEALLVEECRNDLRITSEVCEEVSDDLSTLEERGVRARLVDAVGARQVPGNRADSASLRPACPR